MAKVFKDVCENLNKYTWKYSYYGTLDQSALKTICVIMMTHITETISASNQVKHSGFSYIMAVLVISLWFL